MQSETRIDTHVKINTSIAGNVTKYNNLHTQESFDKKILTLPNFALKNRCGEPKWHLVDWNRTLADSTWQFQYYF